MFELFTAELPHQWEWDPALDDLFARAWFTIDSLVYVVEFKKNNGAEVSFDINPHTYQFKYDRPLTQKHNITGTGHAPQVLSMVGRLILEFIGKMRPNQVWFAAKEESRARAYQAAIRYLKKPAEALGYQTHIEPGSPMKFELVRTA